MHKTRLKIIVGGVAVVVVAGLVWMVAGNKTPSTATNDTPPVAVKKQPQSTVEEWMEKNGAGLKVNEKDDIDETLAHYAAREGRVDVLEWLKENGADLYATAAFRGTPMH